MESQPQNPEFRNNPENFHPCGIMIFNTTSLVSISHFLRPYLGPNTGPFQIHKSAFPKII